MVLAADRMATVVALNLEVERPKSKISRVGHCHTIMGAGDGLVSEEVARLVRHSCQQEQSIENVASSVVAAYTQLRLRRLDETVLRSLGYSLDSFHQKGASQLGPLFPQICKEVAQFELKTEFLVAGFDGELARIAHVHHPGTLRWTDGFDFFSIGSGAVHAFTTLLLSGYSASMPTEQALLQVFRAKRAAENAPGVGDATDLFLASSTQVREVTGAPLDELRKLHEQVVQAARSPDCASLKEALDADPRTP